ncbi:hypothetical protein ES703_92700 [subsurface metagenome]
MTWYEASKDLWEIIDIIADDLIGDAAWEEGDATWDTSARSALTTEPTAVPLHSKPAKV